MRTTCIVVLLCVTIGMALGFPRGKHGGHGKGGKGGRPQRREITEAQSEQIFFCHMAHRACRLVEDGEEPLVDRPCKNNTACDGPSGTISLNGSDYTITFCVRPDKEEKEELDEDERIERLLNRGKPEPNEALRDICKPEHKEDKVRPENPNRKPIWYYRACNVSNDEGELHKRDCKEGKTCTKGPYDAELDGAQVEVSFCEKVEEEVEDGEDGEEGEGEDTEQEPEEEEETEEDRQPFWYEDACLVTDGDDIIKESEDCPGDMECITRLIDMDYDSKSVDAGFCGGFLLRHRRGRRHHRGGKHHKGGFGGKGGDKERRGRGGIGKGKDIRGGKGKSDDRSERPRGKGEGDRQSGGAREDLRERFGWGKGEKGGAEGRPDRRNDRRGHGKGGKGFRGGK